MRSSITPIAISFPFRIDEFGNVATSTDDRRIAADRVRAVVGTSLGERVFRPDFGTTIPSRVFDSVEVVEELIKTDIGRAFSKYLTTLTLSDVLIAYDDRQNIIEVEVLYQLPDNTDGAVTIGIANILNNEIIREELL
jgi:phage baseplate assembly protein W